MTKKFSCLKSKSVYLVGLVLTTVFVLMVPTFQQLVKAGGFQDGQSEAEQDFMKSNGEEKDLGCSTENGFEYWEACKVGYESRWVEICKLFNSSGVCQ